MTDPITNTPNCPTPQTQTTVSTPPISGELSVSVNTPVSHPKVATSPTEEQMFYLGIPMSQRNRSEVMSLLGEERLRTNLNIQRKLCHLLFKQEKENLVVADQEETVESSSGPCLDPAVVPEGQGLVEG